MKSQDAVRRVTIADVARHAGVSTAAVSKVLRNAYGVSADMSQRVRSSMAELEYRPHAAARGMRGRSFTIGLLLDNIRNPFYGDFLDGVTIQYPDWWMNVRPSNTEPLLRLNVEGDTAELMARHRDEALDLIRRH